MRDQMVVILESPVTERYVKKGDIGKIDYTITPNQIQVNGCWFGYDERWNVIYPSDYEKITNILNMSIDREEAKLILQALEQCWNVNGFIDDEEKELIRKLKFEFDIKYHYSQNSANIIFND